MIFAKFSDSLSPLVIHKPLQCLLLVIGKKKSFRHFWVFRLDLKLLAHLFTDIMVIDMITHLLVQTKPETKLSVQSFCIYNCFLFFFACHTNLSTWQTWWKKTEERLRIGKKFALSRSFRRGPDHGREGFVSPL